MQTAPRMHLRVRPLRTVLGARCPVFRRICLGSVSGVPRLPGYASICSGRRALRSRPQSAGFSLFPPGRPHSASMSVDRCGTSLSRTLHPELHCPCSRKSDSRNSRAKGFSGGKSGPPGVAPARIPAHPGQPRPATRGATRTQGSPPHLRRESAAKPVFDAAQACTFGGRRARSNACRSLGRNLKAAVTGAWHVRDRLVGPGAET